MPIRACVFDAYGTLFDVAGAAREAAADPEHPGFAALWPRIAEDWRAKQLQYTWHRAITGDHADFWQVTRDSLDYVLELHGQSDSALHDRLLDLYRALPAYPEVPGMLAALKAKGLMTAVLSNGSPDMLADAVASAGIAGAVDTILSIEDAGIYKPARAVYDLVGDRLGIEPGEVLFVSANGWDAAGGAAYGFRTVWVNRTEAPRERLPGTPATTVSDLSQLTDMDLSF